MENTRQNRPHILVMSHDNAWLKQLAAIIAILMPDVNFEDVTQVDEATSPFTLVMVVAGTALPNELESMPIVEIFDFSVSLPSDIGESKTPKRHYFQIGNPLPDLVTLLYALIGADTPNIPKHVVSPKSEIVFLISYDLMRLHAYYFQLTTRWLEAGATMLTVPLLQTPFIPELSFNDAGQTLGDLLLLLELGSDFATIPLEQFTYQNNRTLLCFRLPSNVSDITSAPAPLLRKLLAYCRLQLISPHGGRIICLCYALASETLKHIMPEANYVFLDRPNGDNTPDIICKTELARLVQHADHEAKIITFDDITAEGKYV